MGNNKSQQVRAEAVANLKTAVSWVLVSTNSSTTTVQGNVKVGGWKPNI